VEALTIVLAVGSVSGWRSGLLGAACGAVLLAATVALAGDALVRVQLNDLIWRWLRLSQACSRSLIYARRATACKVDGL
jgi:uncharacterized membrane protein